MEKHQNENVPQESNAENAKEKINNPNSIGELISVGKDILTSPEKVYRSVRGEEAINDLFESGVVRNKQSAGKAEKSRWGEKVFWSRGAEGKYHGIQIGGYVIEAPYDVAAERVVTKADVTAIYEKTADDLIRNIFSERQYRSPEAENEGHEEKKQEEAERIEELRRELGVSSKLQN